MKLTGQIYVIRPKTTINHPLALLNLEHFINRTLLILTRAYLAKIALEFSTKKPLTRSFNRFDRFCAYFISIN
jgi:hypothetical protein